MRFAEDIGEASSLVADKNSHRGFVARAAVYQGKRMVRRRRGGGWSSLGPRLGRLGARGGRWRRSEPERGRRCPDVPVPWSCGRRPGWLAGGGLWRELRAGFGGRAPLARTASGVAARWVVESPHGGVRRVDGLELVVGVSGRSERRWGGGEPKVAEDPGHDPRFGDQRQQHHGGGAAGAGRGFDTEATAENLRPGKFTAVRAFGRGRRARFGARGVGAGSLGLGSGNTRRRVRCTGSTRGGTVRSRRARTERRCSPRREGRRGTGADKEALGRLARCRGAHHTWARRTWPATCGSGARTGTTTATTGTATGGWTGRLTRRSTGVHGRTRLCTESIVALPSPIRRHG